MTWETVQPIELAWLLLSVLTCALLAALLASGILRWREARPYDGAALIQARVYVAKYATLLAGALGALLLVIPSLFLTPRTQLSGDYWTRVSSVVSPFGVILMLLALAIDAGLLWWMQHRMTDYFRDSANRQHEADLITGALLDREHAADVREEAANAREERADERDVTAAQRDQQAVSRDRATDERVVSLGEVKADTVSIKADTVRLVEAADNLIEEREEGTS